ncbi:MAG: quinone-dependent dihydroorotate dehydrogenase [Bauldia sp.]
MSGVYGAVRPLLTALDPETAHRLAMRALSLGLVPRPARKADARLARSLLGLSFAGPIGLAAGFDKDGEASGPLLGLGFAFVEVGTVTPLPQPGNPRPRLFRLDRDGALINRMGFNNHGFTALKQRLSRRAFGGILGVNIGANKESRDRIADYVAGVETFAGVAEYLAVNVSSPNTPGLRALQGRDELRQLLAAVTAARDGSAAAGRRTPLLLKIAPDLDEAALAAIAEEVIAAGIDGVIVSNTTLDRAGLSDSRYAAEPGGLSGRPLFRKSTSVLAKFRLLVGPGLPLIGVGGVDSGETAWQKILAGADLVQVYTGFIFQGPWIAASIVADLCARLDRDGAPSLAAVVGRDVKRWAAGEAR